MPRFDVTRTPHAQWGDAVAREILAAYPGRALYTTASGISPSGVVHFGNFRDIITSHVVARALKEHGVEAQLLFSWDNFDRLRKVPAGVPASFAAHIGKPLSKIPDPCGAHSSYAEHFQEPFEEAMRLLSIPVVYRNQTALYESGVYDDAIFHALKRRDEIAEILLSYMTEKGKAEKGIDPSEYRANYYPISLYSRFSGTDNTKILSYDGMTTVTYFCADTQQEDTVDLSKVHIAKLSWKIDWPMRWKHESVVFEPGGHDHASPGGSYDVASVIAPRIFDYQPPVFVEYKFVGIQGLGTKMSGSKGNAVSPLELLEIYEPELLTWLYLRKSPDQSFQLAFDSEIYRQYDEFDTEMQKNALPFRQAVGFGQIVQWQPDKLRAILAGMELSYDDASIERRLPLARAWLTKYNREEAIVMRSEINAAYVTTMSEDQKARVRALRDALSETVAETIKELEQLVYSIPKRPESDPETLKKDQRAFFKDVYNLLIGTDTGPRLGTFLWASDRAQLRALLSI